MNNKIIAITFYNSDIFVNNVYLKIMISKIYGKRIIISGLLLLFASNFIYAHNKHSHINRNIIKIPSYKTNNSHLYNHNTENRKILSQINVLKGAAVRNNFILNSYNKILSHNLNYQKNTLYKRIKSANLSINTEIKILWNMENIININPFNYLKKFRRNNYYIPEISYITNKNKFATTNDIKIFNSKIKSSRPYLNSIFYNSEESLVGIKGIGSLISDSKLLIFSKYNFINSHIYYFSKHFNILTTYNKYANSSNYDDKNKLISNNKFIKKLKSKSRNIYMYSKSDLSNKSICHNNNNNNINKKVYISFSALLLVAGIIIVILGKEKVFNKRKSYNPVRSFTRTPGKKEELVSMDNIKTKCVFPGPRANHLQKHIKNSTHHSANSVAEPYNSVDSGHKLDKPEVLMDSRVSLRPVVVHMEKELIPTEKNMLLCSRAEENSLAETKNHTSRTSVRMLADMCYIPYNYEPVLLIQSGINKTRSYPINHNDSQYGDPWINSLYNENEEEILDNNTKITLMNSWFDFRMFPHTQYYKLLYQRKEKARYVDRKTFSKQVDSFLHQKRLSSLLEWSRPNSERIFSNVRTKIMKSSVQTLSRLDKNEAIATLSHIIVFDSREEIVSKLVMLTANGWFKKPYNYLKRTLTSDNITREEYDYIEEINRKFDNMYLLLSDCMNSNNFFKILLNEIDKKINIPEADTEMTQLDRYIVNEIMLDLQELIKMYKLYIYIKDIDVKLLKKHIPERINFPEYIERFKNSKIVKTVYDGPKIFGTTENTIFGLISEFAEV